MNGSRFSNSLQKMLDTDIVLCYNSIIKDNNEGETNNDNNDYSPIRW